MFCPAILLMPGAYVQEPFPGRAITSRGLSKPRHKKKIALGVALGSVSLAVATGIVIFLAARGKLPGKPSVEIPPFDKKALAPYVSMANKDFNVRPPPLTKEYFKKACERWSEYEIDAPKIMFDLVNKVRQDPQMLVPLLEYEMLRFKGNDLYPTTPAEMESTFGIKHPMPSNSLMYNNSFPHEYIDGKERYAAAIKILRKMKPLPELKWSNFLATSMMDVAYSSAAKPLSNVGSHQTFIAAKRGHDPVRMLIDNIVADQKGTFIKLMFGSESRLGIGCKPSSSHGQKLVLCFADKVRDAEAAEDTAPYNKALLRSYKPANFDPARYLTCEELNRQRNTFLKSEVKNFIEPDLIKKLKASADPNPPKDYIDVDTHVVWKSLDDGRIAGEHKYTYNLPNSKPVTHTAVFYDKPSDLK
eukprot:GHVT01096702.1.p1 GENE.GHVT01096702.1~~GHVT01096702.1.p1  ORF type:complete len:416 (+),score=18.67 GHVT01096702.1:3237-4484(+)